jgi:hypothetical protein
MDDPVERYTDADDQVRVSIYQRADGHFEYALERFFVDDFPEVGLSNPHWEVIDGSGVYNSAETAKREAAIQYQWVKSSAVANGS